MKTIIYIRVSSEMQSKHGFSMENQKDRAEAYCTYKGFTDTEIITDEAKSGKRFDNRDGIQQIIKLAETKQIDNLIVYSISRLGRNAIETLAFIEFLKKKKVTLHSITESADGSTPYGRYIIGIIALNAQLESELIGERTQSILSNKKSKNQTYSSAPFGLKIVGRVVSEDGKVIEPGILLPDDNEALIVKTIFDRNTYPEEIKNFLNNNSIKPKKAAKWSNQAVKNVIDNKAIYQQAGII